MLLSIHFFPPNAEQPFWVAGIPELPGVGAIGESEAAVTRDVQASALEALADAIRFGEREPFALFEHLAFLPQEPAATPEGA